ncbi:MAG: hypothetical protein EBT99_16395, partial [Betaproteobacteria bacterium]|nr:hypothetical protein [Betaproteobacteria bacterium]
MRQVFTPGAWLGPNVQSALEAGMSRGDVLYTVFGNLAARELDPGKAGYNAADPYLGVAKQFANKVAVAKYYTETMQGDSTDLGILRDVVARVDQFSNVTDSGTVQNLIRGFDAAKQLEMYRFFLVAFDAAPGVTYWGQLKAAVESGLDTKAIVNIFTTKQQFLSVYPNDLSGAAFSK